MQMTTAYPISIIKASGKKEFYSAEKLRNSLERAGASEDDVNDIQARLEKKLYNNISTREIYEIAFKLLRESARHLAARYNLKRAIMELGPSGFPFEQFIAGILRYQGFKTRVSEIVNGQCVNHEIDIIAEHEGNVFMVECKFHNQGGTVCDVKIPLYVQARFKDIEDGWMKLPWHNSAFNQGWVVTNTRFTDDAVRYGVCAGLRLLGWDYPQKLGLKSIIDHKGLYPITCLTSIGVNEKQRLLARKIVMCRDMVSKEGILADEGLDKEKILKVTDEAARLCRLSDTFRYNRDKEATN